MKVLIACECSGIVKTAFRSLMGVDAWSCDIKPSEIPNDHYHIQDDVLKHLTDGWDLMIAHPDCTYLANSGVRWLLERPERWREMRQAAEFFNALLDAPILRICVENPIQHKYARQYIRLYDQIIQPYQFGEPYTKATCLWLKGVPKLTPTKIIPTIEVKAACHLEPPSPERKTNRARTYQGIAAAMAQQWGKCLPNQGGIGERDDLSVKKSR